MYALQCYIYQNVLRIVLLAQFCRSLKSLEEILLGQLLGPEMWAMSMVTYFPSVLTDSEGDGLGDMVTGLVERYRKSNVPPPKLLYVDRDCCSTKLKSHFQELSNLVIRLDVWHFMRRFAAGCCSESHALYATFMSRLSACVFEWDTEDLQRLYAAKRGQLSASGVWRKRKEDVAMHITKKELAFHCK